MEKTSVGERKMRSALINTLLQLNEDKKYDIAVSLASDIGYKLVQVNPVMTLDDFNEQIMQPMIDRLKLKK